MDNIRAGQPEPSPWTAGLRYADHGSVPKLIRAAGGKVWSAFHGDLSAALVTEAHDLGLTVLAWTVNEPADISRVLDWGVDGIVSDRPDRVRDEMARRGMVLPKGVDVRP
jgi:glycerophosphoryl diester phosphodiesterase